MTLLVLGALFRLLPDLLQRTRWVLQSLHKDRLRVHGILNLPGNGPVLIVTNAATANEHKNVAWASDRQVHFLNGNDASQIKRFASRGEVIAVSVISTATVAYEKVRADVGSQCPVLPVVSAPSEVRFGTLMPSTSSADEVLAAIDKTKESPIT